LRPSRENASPVFYALNRKKFREMSLNPENTLDWKRKTYEAYTLSSRI
jgi:hypothetical protein